MCTTQMRPHWCGWPPHIASKTHTPTHPSAEGGVHRSHTACDCGVCVPVHRGCYIVCAPKRQCVPRAWPGGWRLRCSCTSNTTPARNRVRMCDALWLPQNPTPVPIAHGGERPYWVTSEKDTGGDGGDNLPPQRGDGKTHCTSTAPAGHTTQQRSPGRWPRARLPRR